ncbi:MAG: hypothetical protein IIA48_09495 [Bacteroidetes bacterium]|nr:hypothetical protein [Bacteroidota bacterium]
MITTSVNKLVHKNQWSYYSGEFPEDDSNYIEGFRNSTSGSIDLSVITPTSIVEHDLEQKINEKYNLFIKYFKQELDFVKSRVERYQKVVKNQNRELNTIKKEMNFQKLDKIAAYDNNWNGEGTYKFDEKIISITRAILFSTNLNRQPQIFPTNSNTIQLEYEDRLNRHLEVEVLPDKFLVFHDFDGNESEYETPSFDDIIEVLNEF